MEKDDETPFELRSWEEGLGKRDKGDVIQRSTRIAVGLSVV